MPNRTTNQPRPRGITPLLILLLLANVIITPGCDDAEPVIQPAPETTSDRLPEDPADIQDHDQAMAMGIQILNELAIAIESATAHRDPQRAAQEAQAAADKLDALYQRMQQIESASDAEMTAYTAKHEATTQATIARLTSAMQRMAQRDALIDALEPAMFQVNETLIQIRALTGESEEEIREQQSTR